MRKLTVIAILQFALQLHAAKLPPIEIRAIRSSSNLQEVVVLHHKEEQLFVSLNTNAFCRKSVEIGDFIVKNAGTNKEIQALAIEAGSLAKSTQKPDAHAWRIFIGKTEVQGGHAMWEKTLTLIEKTVCRDDRKSVNTVKLVAKGLDVEIQTLQRGKIKSRKKTNLMNACPRFESGVFICIIEAGLIYLPKTRLD